MKMILHRLFSRHSASVVNQCLAFLLFFPLGLIAQQNVTIGIPHTQSLGAIGAGAFTDNVTLPGWYLSAGTVVADDGSNGTPGLYRYGGSTLGGNAAGTAMGLRIRNNSSATVRCVTISYTGAQWRVGESGGSNAGLTFAYGTGATVTSLGAAGTGVAALNLNAPQTNATCGAGGAAIDGASAANQGTITHVITGLNIPAGEEMMLRWAVAATGCADHGMGLNSVTVTTHSTDTPPISFDATSVSTCSFVAVWTFVPGATHYLLDVSTDPAFGSFLTGFNGLNVGNLVTFVATPVAANTTFYYRVRAVTPCGTTANSNVSEATTLAFLATPTSLEATDIGCTSFTANWSPLAGASSYRIDVSTTAGFTAILPAYNNIVVAGTSLNVTGLNLNTSYFYRI